MHFPIEISTKVKSPLSVHPSSEISIFCHFWSTFPWKPPWSRSYWNLYFRNHSSSDISILPAFLKSLLGSLSWNLHFLIPRLVKSVLSVTFYLHSFLFKSLLGATFLLKSLLSDQVKSLLCHCLRTALLSRHSYNGISTFCHLLGTFLLKPLLKSKLYFLFTLLVKSLLSVTLHALSYWNLYGHFPIKFSTSWSRFYTPFFCHFLPTLTYWSRFPLEICIFWSLF